MIVICILGVLTLFIFLWGLQLMRGHFLNTIAGNNLVDKFESTQPEQIELGKRVGRTMISASVMALFLTLALLFEFFGYQELHEIFMLLTYVSIIPLLLFTILSFCWSVRHMK